jgi:hypothetical protein
MCSCTLPAINPADYNQGCVTSEDCIAVWVGDVCSCACNGAAINKSDQARYAADVQSRLSHCGPFPGCGVCDQVRTTCMAGRCAVIDCGAICSDAGVGDGGPDAQ